MFPVIEYSSANSSINLSISNFILDVLCKLLFTSVVSSFLICISALSELCSKFNLFFASSRLLYVPISLAFSSSPKI